MSDDETPCLVCGAATEGRGDECRPCTALLAALALTVADLRNVTALEVVEPTTAEGRAAGIEWRALVAFAEMNLPGDPS